MVTRHYQLGLLAGAFALSQVLKPKPASECGGMLGCLTTKDDAKSFCQKYAYAIQTTPYLQCGMAFTSAQALQSQKFTSMSAEMLNTKVNTISQDEFMLNPKFVVSQEDDCFTKMAQHFESLRGFQTRQCVIGSRYASCKGQILEHQAHPVEPESRRFSLFHNGFISNYKELLTELKTEKQMTDTEIIATLVDQQLSQSGSDLCSAIKTVCETKLHGTWRLAVMAQDKLYLATNSGDFFVGRSEDCFVFCSSDSLHSLFPNFDKIKRNTLVEVNFSDLKMVEVAALKKKVHKTQTKQTEHIYLDEILQSVETV